MLIKMWKHFKLVNKHRWLVFIFAVKAGIPWRGMTHDLSKYSPIEFIESSKYYDGKASPYIGSRKSLGYSKAWLHHKAINKHHEDYWYDWNNSQRAAVMPYKYAVELICDTISAGKVYLGDKWDNSKPLEYFNEKKIKEVFNPMTIDFLVNVYTQIRDEGIDKAINKKNLKEKYNKYCTGGNYFGITKVY